MWEPRLDKTARQLAVRSVKSPEILDGEVDSEPLPSTSDGQSAKLSAELLILNRFGIGYPFLKAAHRLSIQYGLDAREILFKSGIISEDIWIESQCLLESEREKVRNRYELDFRKLDLAVNNLHRTLPAYSAHRTFTGWQSLLLLVSVFAIAYLFAYNTQIFFFIATMTVSTFYTGVVILRALMLARYDKRVKTTQTLPTLQPAQMPTYSVVVPLYKEANQIGPLTKTLMKLNWPKDRLDIKLICESDDIETLDEIRDTPLPDYFDLIVVPNAYPKTKPKALNYALSECRGEYLVIYDAEDRPSPNQLREAFAKFSTEDKRLACLQAPLIISNAEQSWLAHIFYIEYLTLFRGILPVLASWNMPLPLGGTSNHFKVSILKDVGAWDPYNVTEDADLGIRMAREGYRTSTISLPTYEEAPPTLDPWIKQRTRWMKGWMQTILVHNRNPFRLFLDMGLRDGLVFHLLLTSIVLSSLFHPILIGLTLVQIIQLEVIGSQDWLLTLGIYNLVAGYTTYCLFAALVLKSNNSTGKWALLLTIPVYWFLISIAGWRALFHLLVMPHRWEKTPHGLAQTKI